jgi:sugar phosphate isomerase/epimerase
MILTRRDFGKLALAGSPTLAGISSLAGLGSSALAQPAAKPNRSYINGVQFGLQPFCYHDLPMNRENRPTLIQRAVQNGFGMIELHATWCEPRFDAPGVSAQEAREKLRNWRLTTPADYYHKIKKEFDNAAITIFTYWVGINESYTDAEIAATFEAAKALGAKGAVGSQGLAVSRRLIPFAAKHGIFMGLHNHDNLSDPDALSNEASFETGLAYSPNFKATLDVRHFTAGNGDCVGFLERHYERVSSIHVGDRRKNNGRSAPFGEGDAPIIQVLRLIRDNQWPIVALLEFEHGTLRTGTEEVQLMFDYCKRALV